MPPSAPPPSDPNGSLEALRARYGPRLRWWMLLSVMVGTMASVMASTIVNVAVPDMSRHFTLTPSRAQWLSASFMAAMTVSMLTTPWLLQRWGYRRAYCGAVLLLMAGGLLGGSSPWFALVMAMRVAEGLAAGVLQPIPAIIIMRAFAPGEQGRAMGLFGFGVVLAPAVGPSIGGLLVEWFGWRSIFFVVTPLCAIALPLARRYLPVTAPGGLTAGPQQARFDLPGLALLSMGVLLLLNGLVHLHDSAAGTAIALLVLAAAAGAGFVWRQRTAASPLLDLGVFLEGHLLAGSVVAFFYGMALFASTYLVPVFMQTALHLPPSQAGAVLFPAGVMLAVTIPLAGRLADRLPARLLIVTGLVLLALSLAAMRWVGEGTALAIITAWAVLGRIGLGLIMPSLNLGALRGVPPAQMSSGASAINFTRQFGGAVGVSLVGVVLEWRLAAQGLTGTPDSPLASGLGAFHDTFLVVAATMALALVAAWRIGAKTTAPARPPASGR